MKAVGFLFSGVLALTSPAAIAADVIPTDPVGITLMTMRGESGKLKALGYAKDYSHFPARAAYFRTIGDIDNSTKWAERCLTDRGVAEQSGQGVLFLCMSMLAGNQLAAGNIAGWATTMTKVRRIYNNSVSRDFPAGDSTYVVAKPDFDKFVHWPAMSYAKHTKVIEIPIKNMRGFSVISFKIRGGADGKKRDVSAQFILDTGSARSIMTRQVAQSLGLALTDNFQFESLDPTGQPKFALASPVDLAASGVTLKNVSFSVSDSVNLTILGLDVLRQLGQVVISKDSLRILPDSMARTCADRLTTTSSLWGDYWGIRLKSKVADADALLLIDTGLVAGLQSAGLYKPAQDEVEKSKKTSGLLGTKDLKYVERKVFLEIGDVKETTAAQVTDQAAEVFPMSWKLGNDFISRHDLYLDANRGYACLWQGTVN